jgi:methylenetetrahydrofolate reductase (NADPH)
MCASLIERGAPGLHFYTLNQAGLTAAIWRALGLTGATPPREAPHKADATP